jgi:hypothetical protein
VVAALWVHPYHPYTLPCWHLQAFSVLKNNWVISSIERRSPQKYVYEAFGVNHYNRRSVLVVIMELTWLLGVWNVLKNESLQRWAVQHSWWLSRGQARPLAPGSWDSSLSLVSFYVNTPCYQGYIRNIWHDLWNLKWIVTKHDVLACVLRVPKKIEMNEWTIGPAI